jgi:hypothetical protein
MLVSLNEYIQNVMDLTPNLWATGWSKVPLSIKSTGHSCVSTVLKTHTYSCFLCVAVKNRTCFLLTCNYNSRNSIMKAIKLKLQYKGKPSKNE